MASSSTHDEELQTHLRKVRRMLSQINQHTVEVELYESINEIMTYNARQLETSEYDISTHPQAIFFLKRDDLDNASATDASSPADTSALSTTAETSESEEDSAQQDTGPNASQKVTDTDRQTTTASDKYEGVSTFTGVPVSLHHNPSRFPDFVSRLICHGAHRRVLFIVEVKRLPNDYTYKLGTKPKMRDHPELMIPFKVARKQIVEQVQLAFARYPEETEIRAMCIVGLLFEVLLYTRKDTPNFDEYSPDEATDYHTDNYGPQHIFNQGFTGYTPAFRKQWRNAVTVKANEIKELLHKGKKGSVALQPLLEYDFSVDSL